MATMSTAGLHGRPRRSLRRRGIVAAAAVSLGAHLACAAWFAHSTPQTPQRGARAAAAAPAPIQARWIRVAGEAVATEPGTRAGRTALQGMTVGHTMARPAAASPGEPAAADPWSRFLGPQAIDRSAMPKSAPDETMLEGLAFTGLPIRLRVFIESSGEVVAVRPLQFSPDDEEAVERLRAMFLATSYLAALRAGQATASYQDVELRVGELL